MIEWDAPEEAQGKRLDVALAAHPDIGSRAKAQRLLEAGLQFFLAVLEPWRKN